MLSFLRLGWVFSSLQPRLIKANGIMSHLFPPGGCRLLEFSWNSGFEDQKIFSSLPTLSLPSSLVRVFLAGIQRSASQTSVMGRSGHSCGLRWWQHMVIDLSGWQFIAHVSVWKTCSLFDPSNYTSRNEHLAVDYMSVRSCVCWGMILLAKIIKRYIFNIYQ